MTIISNWKFLMICYILTFGLWGFIIKIVSTKLDWKTTMLYVWMTIFIILMLSYFKKANFGWSKFHALAVLAGIAAAIGTIAFYRALPMAPASLIIPLSTQYILVTVLLCVIYLKEPMSLRIIAGIACSIAAIVLLSR